MGVSEPCSTGAAKPLPIPPPKRETRQTQARGTEKFIASKSAIKGKRINNKTDPRK
jgi:hypothetical protein